MAVMKCSSSDFLMNFAERSPGSSPRSSSPEPAEPSTSLKTSSNPWDCVVVATPSVRLVNPQDHARMDEDEHLAHLGPCSSANLSHTSAGGDSPSATVREAALLDPVFGSDMCVAVDMWTRHLLRITDGDGREDGVRGGERGGEDGGGGGDGCGGGRASSGETTSGETSTEGSGVGGGPHTACAACPYRTICGCRAHQVAQRETGLKRQRINAGGNAKSAIHSQLAAARGGDVAVLSSDSLMQGIVDEEAKAGAKAGAEVGVGALGGVSGGLVCEVECDACEGCDDWCGSSQCVSCVSKRTAWEAKWEGGSGGKNAGKRAYTMCMVRRRNHAASGMLVAHGNVYDITEYDGEESCYSV